MARVSRKGNNTCQSESKISSKDTRYKTAIYIRLSKEELGQQTNRKLDNQEQVIKDYIKGKPEFEIIQTYCDNGCTGTNFDRTAFVKLMEDLRTGAVDCVMVKDLSRLGRNHIETEQYIREIFPFLGTRFVSVNDHFDSLRSDDNMMVSLKNIINAAYAKDISRKICSAKEAQRQRGEFVGNLPPYGYERLKANVRKLEVNEETAKVIQRIFDLKLLRKTNTEIAHILNAEGEIAPMTYWYQRGVLHHEKYANRIWVASTVKVILGNQMYVGDMVQGKKKICLAEGQTKVQAIDREDYVVVHNTHKALIEHPVFEKVQAICEEQLEQNRAKRNRYETIQSTENILENKVFSNEGLKMYRSRNVYEGNRITYGYSTLQKRRNDGSEYAFYYISEVNIFNALQKATYRYIEVLFSLQEMIGNPEFKMQLKKEQKERKEALNFLEKESSRYIERLSDLYQEMVEGIITLSEYEDMRRDYKEVRKNLKNQVCELSRKQENPFMELRNSEQLKEYRKFLKNKTMTKELVELLVKNVIVEKKKVEVVFLFEDEAKEAYQRMMGARI